LKGLFLINHDVFSFQKDMAAMEAMEVMAVVTEDMEEAMVS
jgi:hypothetical protein